MRKQLKELFDIDISLLDSLFLEKIIQAHMESMNIVSKKVFVASLRENNEELVLLKKSLNNNFSEFFRDKLTFSYLEQIILPELIHEKVKKKQKEIRIWSAACSSGQEAYSLAILCNELSKNLKTSIQFRIFATDISGVEVQKAKKGLYSEGTLNNVTLKRMKENFIPHGTNFSVNNSLKKYINFSTYDLLDSNNDSPPSSIFGSFDLVFCSNLLFYYSKEAQSKILSKVNNCLLSDGYLIIGEAEKSIVYDKMNYISNTSISKKLKNNK